MAHDLLCVTFFRLQFEQLIARHLLRGGERAVVLTTSQFSQTIKGIRLRFAQVDTIDCRGLLRPTHGSGSVSAMARELWPSQSSWKPAAWEGDNATKSTSSARCESAGESSQVGREVEEPLQPNRIGLMIVVVRRHQDCQPCRLARRDSGGRVGPVRAQQRAAERISRPDRDAPPVAAGGLHVRNRERYRSGPRRNRECALEGATKAELEIRRPIINLFDFP